MKKILQNIQNIFMGIIYVLLIFLWLILFLTSNIIVYLLSFINQLFTGGERCKICFYWLDYRK